MKACLYNTCGLNLGFACIFVLYASQNGFSLGISYSEFIIDVMVYF